MSTETPETAAVVVEQPDEGAEYMCSNCGTRGWDCLDQLNRFAGQRCCGPCGLYAGHAIPGAFEAGQEADLARRERP